MAFEYIASGAADEITLRANPDAFNRILLKAPVFVDVSTKDKDYSRLAAKNRGRRVSPVFRHCGRPCPRC